MHDGVLSTQTPYSKIMTLCVTTVGDREPVEHRGRGRLSLGGGVRPREDTFLMGLCAGKLSAEVFVGNIDFLTVRDGREV